MTASTLPCRGARRRARPSAQTPALRGADLSVTAGEILAVMGPSGSGKSTLLHCLAGIFAPTAARSLRRPRGWTRCDEPDAPSCGATAFGFVFQFGQLVPELTADDNVALPLLLGRYRREPALARAAAWFAAAGAGRPGGRRTGELSGGQAQRVAIARPWSPGREVVFADEPTGALDSLTGELVMELLVGLAREEGTTVIVVPTTPAWPPAPTGRSSCATAGSPTRTRAGSADDPAGPAAVAARRQGGGGQAGADRRRRWRSASRCCWPRCRSSTPSRPPATARAGSARAARRPVAGPSTPPLTARCGTATRTTTRARRSRGWTPPRSAPGHRSSPACPACPAPASTTPRPRWPGCWTRRRAEQLADRFPGTRAGLIGRAALSGPTTWPSWWG